MTGGGKPDCVKCGWVPIIPKNYDVMNIIYKYSSFMVDGMGGMNSQGIEKVLDWEGIEPEDKSKYIQKIIIYLTTALKRED